MALLCAAACAPARKEPTVSPGVARPGPVAATSPVGAADSPAEPAPSGEPVEAPSPEEGIEAPAQGAAAPAGEETAGGQAEAAGSPNEGAPSEVEFVLVEEPAPGEELSEAPHDELARESPAITPEEAQRELDLVSHAPPSFDIPVVTNKEVLAWVDHYAHQRPDKFVLGLVRSGRYLSMFRRIFEEHGLPQDLVYMAHVESAYKTTAYSRARAKGIFQFISGTARRYGLRIDSWVDERSDPEKSARAAAAYLKDLYAEFSDWYLALAAYNAGEGKIRRALAAMGRADFWDIARTRYLRRETKNYVPAILAATLISKEPAKYGFDFVPEAALDYESVQVRGAADLQVLARCAETDVDTLRGLNPALRRGQTPPRATTEVRVPVGKGERTLAALEAIPAAERVTHLRHHVRRGETLSTIARTYGVSVWTIQQANRLGRSTLIRAGQTLLIPTAGAAAGTLASRGQGSEGGAASGPLVYRVRRGDTLSGIGRRHRTTAEAIAAANGISVNSPLRVGQRLRIVPGARSPAQARGALGGGAARGPDSPLLHTVRRGETLWRIAMHYQTSIQELCHLNNISPHSTLEPGMVLTVRSE
jgi:membrane-bound lytic murein transglycosylase D